MIDLHSHYLWELDDGPKTLDESLKIIENAKKAGVAAMVCTPHVHHPRYADVTREKIIERHAELMSILPDDPGIFLFWGAEYYFTDKFINEVMTHPQELITLNQRNYLLFEFGPFFTLTGLGQIIHSLVGNGRTPLLAHPERHTHLSTHPEIITQLLDMGCKLQINSKSLMGLYGKSIQKTAQEILERGAAHVIASDSHSATGISTHYQDAFGWVSKTWGKRSAELLFIINPWLIIHGQPTVDFFDEHHLQRVLTEHCEVFK